MPHKHGSKGQVGGYSLSVWSFHQAWLSLPLEFKTFRGAGRA